MLNPLNYVYPAMMVFAAIADDPLLLAVVAFTAGALAVACFS
jgi:hypothetical protein